MLVVAPLLPTARYSPKDARRTRASVPPICMYRSQSKASSLPDGRGGSSTSDAIADESLDACSDADACTAPHVEEMALVEARESLALLVAWPQCWMCWAASLTLERVAHQEVWRLLRLPRLPALPLRGTLSSTAHASERHSPAGRK